MSEHIPSSPRRSTNSFEKVLTGFLKQPGLPFSGVLTAAQIEAVFRKHDGLFGMESIYGTATVLWAFLSQVLRDDKMAACQAAVASIITHRQLLGLSVPTDDAGDYCRVKRLGKYDHLIVCQSPDNRLVASGKEDSVVQLSKCPK